MNVPVSIYPVMACTGDVGQISSVRFDLVGARGGEACIEKTVCAALSGSPSAIGDVMANLPPSVLFDVPADRGYEIEVIGYATADCSYGQLSLIRFCGQSMAVNFTASGSAGVSIGVTCGAGAASCASSDTILLFCQ